MRRKLLTLITVTAAALIAVIGTSGTGQADALHPATSAEGDPGWSATPAQEPGWS